MRFKQALLGATLLATLPAVASAQTVNGLYIAGGAGVNWVQETDLGISGGLGAFLDANSISRNGNARFEIGWVGLASIGWGFGNGLRAEIEGSYRQNDVDRITGFAPLAPWGGISGTQRTYAVMANLLYDFNLGPVMPYIGAGVGYAWTDWSGVRAAGGAGGVLVGSSGTEGNFAYQGIIGAALPIASVPGLAITAEYRYFATLENDFAISGTVVGGPTAAGRVSADNANHSILLGVRYNFGQAPRAAAPVAAAPAAARSFIVFFDFDRADLTPRAREIIGQAAQASRTGTTRIEVAGHADRSGTPQYNQGLSQRRANNVAAELVSQGVARNAISVAAFGESRPLVPTADGVREPQNRRVEIVLR